MAQDIEELKRLLRTLKTLDWSEEDIEKTLKIKKEDIRNLIKDIGI